MKESADRRLSSDEAFRAAFYMIDRYLSLDADRGGELSLLWSYMLSDPARHDDWSESVERALADPGWGSDTERPMQSWNDFERSESVLAHSLAAFPARGGMTHGRAVAHDCPCWDAKPGNAGSIQGGE